MKNDIEKIRAAVLAYCEEVCPNVGDGHKETVNSGTIIHSKDRAWSWLDGLGSRIYINDNMSRATATAMYAILGLETRDALAECERLYLAKFDAIQQSRDIEREMASATLKDLKAERARNTALVAALKSLKSVVGYKPNPRGEIIRHRNDLGIFIDDAIATNTEKGGVQG